MTRRSLKVVDLFAGCGGLSFGFERGVGDSVVKHVAAVEMDPEAAATYARNVSKHIYVGDIANWFDSGSLPTGEVDVVLGGPPCQGFSALGKQDVHDHRNDLWDMYVAAVQAMTPAVFVLENVPQFLRSAQYGLLAAECRSGGRLANYTIEFAQVLDASLYGAAQRRKRAIVVGRRSDIDPFGVPPPDAQPRTVREAFAGLSKLDRKPRWRERLPDMEIPTLVVLGRRNRFFPLGNGEALSRDIPGGATARARGGCHCVPQSGGPRGRGSDAGARAEHGAHWE